MSWLLIANNVTSGVVILACWWLAHMNARSRPPGRAIAAGYGLVGFSILFTLVIRNLGIDPRWFIVVTKTMLAGTLLLTIVRRIRIGDR